MHQFTINADLCTRCGLCAGNCPAMVINQEGDNLPTIDPESGERCIRCQQCLAICPTAALSIFGKDPANSTSLTKETFPPLDQMKSFVRSRRSIRKYRNEEVDSDRIKDLLTTLSNVPSAANNAGWTFHVIDSLSTMDRLREITLAGLREALAEDRIPDHFVYMKQAVKAYDEFGADIVYRGAPHLIVVSTPKATYGPEIDISIALSYFELLAQSAGLGTTWCGMLKMACMVIPGLAAQLGIPDDHVFYAMLFGQPAVRFARGVQRDDAARQRTITLNAADK